MRNSSSLLNIQNIQNDSDSLMLMIHGAGGRSDQWKNQISYFKNNYSIVAPDLPGHGKSPLVRNGYRYSELIDTLAEIFQQNKKKKNIIMGHSYGAILSLGLASIFKDDINQLVLINSIPPMPIQTPAIWKLPVFMLELLRPVFSKNFVKISFDRMTPAELIQEEKKISDTNSMKMMKKLVYGMQGIPLIQLEKLNIPALVIHGINDGLIPHSIAMTALQGLPKMQFITIDSSSHLCILEKPQEVNLLIKKFSDLI